MGAGYCAGIAAGLYPEDIAARLSRSTFAPQRDGDWVERHYGGWKRAVAMLLGPKTAP